MRLTDSLAPVPDGQISKIDFKIVKDGRLRCDYRWGSVDATQVIDTCDDVDNDCDGRVDETPRGSNLGPCCTQNSDCMAPTSLCVDRRCEVCDPNRQLGCSDGGQCILRKERPACQGCQVDEECTENRLCRGGTCVQCDADTNEGCPDEAPICSTASGKAICLPCETGQCSGGLTCHMGACVSCVAGRDDCPHEQPVCDGVGTAAACRACQNDGECPDQTTCLNGACEICTPDDASRCPDDRPYCVRSVQDGGSTPYVCSACSGHDECLARDESKPYCVAGECQVCDPAQSTTCDPSQPICAQTEGGSFTCRGCDENRECEGVTPNRPICSTEGLTRGRCVACTESSGACPADSYCVNHQCSPCQPGTNNGCNGEAKPLCAPREDRPGLYHCTHCNRDVRRELSGCPANRVCALVREGTDPVCEVCDPFTGDGCTDMGLICARNDAAGYGCRPCRINSTECRDGQYNDRVCRFSRDLSRCLACDPEVPVGVSNGCIDVDKPFCLEGLCSPCDPRSHLGCDEQEDEPICRLTDNGRSACTACVNDTECVRKNGTYCDEASGRCLLCPENPRVGDNIPDGCPQPVRCEVGDCMDPTPFCVAQFGECKACDPFSETQERYACDVSTDTPVCRDGACAGCDTDEQCQLHPEARPFCRQNLCVICDPQTHAGCQSTTFTKCAADASRCVQCRDDADCNEGLSCNEDSGLCGCENDAQCVALSPDRPVCRMGAGGQNECQPCSIQTSPDRRLVWNDCQEREQCASSIRCQLCLDGGEEDGVRVRPMPQRVPQGDEIPDEQASPDNSLVNYGCAENSEIPICVAGLCKACQVDGDCFKRPGGRDVCRDGRCEFCDEEGRENCAILSKVLPQP